MIIRFINNNTGKIIALDTNKKIYEWCGYYDGKILNEGSMIMTTLIYVINNAQLDKIERELKDNGYTKLGGIYENTNG